MLFNTFNNVLHVSYPARFIFTRPRFDVENNMILSLFPSYFGRKIADMQVYFLE
jgi:hypothetical protein